ncbi:MAG TPA: CHAT domain-containing protein [Kofleriaceae bacterium]
MTPFRLLVLGDLPSDGGHGELISVADYRQARALARSPLPAGEIVWFRDAIRRLRGFIEHGSPVLEPSFLKQLGGRLFEITIRGAVRDLFITATAQRNGFVPFELFMESSALASWPWEYMFDTGTKMFVCREFHPISRSLFDQGPPTDPRPARARLRLLVVIGSADDDEEVEADEEVQLIESVFRTFLKGGRFDIVAEPLSAIELTTRLQAKRGEFDIIHFLGHSGFDAARDEGYLRLTKAGMHESTKLYANDFAQAAADSGIRLAFLNACETGRNAIAEEPARSSVAAALLGRGIPAVVAHQFSVPDNGAHFFAGVFYDVLSAGRPLVEAMRAGRAAMGHANDGRFFDWGIPVLYTRDPLSVVFPAPEPGSFELSPELGLAGGSDAIATTRRRPAQLIDPPLVASAREATQAPHRLGVAIVDIDARAGFLANVIEQANGAQDYYQLHLAYLPVPSGAVRKDNVAPIPPQVSPQLFIPALEDFAKNTPQQLGTDRVCFITRNLLAGKDRRGIFWNHFGATLDDEHSVFFVSTADLREFAQEAGTSFAKAALLVCLSMLIAIDERWGIEYHMETAGCLMDYCADRHDMVLSLKRMSFDHTPCRSKIKDQKMLAAIDAIIALPADH